MLPACHLPDYNPSHSPVLHQTPLKHPDKIFGTSSWADKVKFYCSASKAGSFRPAKNSSIAPPPEETNENLESRLFLAKNSTVSPPPTTSYAGLSIIALAIALLPLSYPSSNSPKGPFQTTVLALAIFSLN